VSDSAPSTGEEPGMLPTRSTIEKSESKQLTQKICDAATAKRHERKELRDRPDGRKAKGVFGLSLRVTGPSAKYPTGHRAWYLTYHGQRDQAEIGAGVSKWVLRRVRLGDYSELTLDEARNKARTLKGEARQGRDPSKAKKLEAAKQKAEAAKVKAEQEALANRVTVKMLLEHYLKHGMRGRAPTHIAATTSMFQRFVYPKPATDEYQELVQILGHKRTLGDKAVADVETDDVSEILQGMIGEDGSRGVVANRLLTGLKAAFNWTCENKSRWLKVNPIDAMSKPHKEGSESRFLTDDELPHIWAAADKLGYPCGDALKLMLLTGQRRGDVSRMRFKHLDLKKGAWTQPAWIDRALGQGGNKARRQHFLVLPPRAVEILRRLEAEMATHPGRKPSDDHVFVEKTGKPLENNWHWAAPKLRELADEIAGKKLDHWEVEFCRHTVRTALSAKPVSAPVIVGELILNHAVEGKLRKTYDQHDFIEEMADALAKWERKLTGIVNGGAAKVVAFPQVAG
jgi:integrase